VVEAAAELVNAEGLEALSLGRLAGRLGIQPPSLYNHVQGLPGLQRELALLSTRRLGECMAEAALGKSGRPALLAIAQAFRSFVRDNPGLYLAGVRSARYDPGNPELEQAQARVVNVALAVMASFGLQGDDALHAVRALRSLVHGFATLEISGGFGLALDCDESFRRLVEMLVTGLESQSAQLLHPSV